MGDQGFSQGLGVDDLSEGLPGQEVSDLSAVRCALHSSEEGSNESDGITGKRSSNR